MTTFSNFGFRGRGFISNDTTVSLRQLLQLNVLRYKNKHNGTRVATCPYAITFQPDKPVIVTRVNQAVCYYRRRYTDSKRFLLLGALIAFIYQAAYFATISPLSCMLLAVSLR